MPRLPVKMFFRYSGYAFHIGSFVPPSITRNVSMMPGFDWICAGVSRCISPPSGSPGIRRGNRKLSVIATQIAKK